MAQWRPNSDLPNDGKMNTTSDFHVRYTNDPEFKRQVDEGRKRAGVNRAQAALKDSLTMVQRRKRLY